MKSPELPLIRIIKPWREPDWFRQTPGCSGVWGGCRFTEEPVSDPDYLIVCNHVEDDVTIQVDLSRVWLLLQEPPVPSYRWLQAGFGDFARIYGPGADSGPQEKYRSQHGGLPWHVGRSYDELLRDDLPSKTVDLTWVTSNSAQHAGHKLRLRFLQRLRQQNVSLALYGRGFQPIADKWTALAPARYALAIENHRCAHYWTEKVADCFLAGAMPIYWGATNLAEYFPPESFVEIDIADRHAPQRVVEIVRSNLVESRREAMAEARRRVLEEHQFFPLMSREILRHELEHPCQNRVEYTIRRIDDVTRYQMSASWTERLLNGVRRRLKPAGT